MKNKNSLYKGLFSDTKDKLLTNLSPKVSIVNIDSDLYESARDALNIIEPRLQVGSVLFFDDYNAFNADNRKGERKAFSEFCEKTNFRFEKWFTYQYSGEAFLCVSD